MAALSSAAGVVGGVARGAAGPQASLSFRPDPELWTNIPLLVKILKLVINELSSVMEANAARQAAPTEWGQGARPGSLCPERLSGSLSHVSAARLGWPAVLGTQAALGLSPSPWGRGGGRGRGCSCSRLPRRLQ